MDEPEFRQSETSGPNRKKSAGEVNGHILTVVTLIGIYLCYRLAQPFLPALLLYFLPDRRAALASLRALSFLPHGQIDRMFARVVNTIHATVYGTLAMAALQGILGGLMFWILGLPSPLLWGIIMGLLAIIPVLGAFIIWIPAALWLASQGDWGKALILTAWGGIVVAESIILKRKTMS